jgi:hypothetical protein
MVDNGRQVGEVPPEAKGGIWAAPLTRKWAKFASVVLELRFLRSFNKPPANPPPDEPK